MKLDKVAHILPNSEPTLNPLFEKIPVCEPRLDGNELKYVIECIKLNWISSMGRYVKEFEEKFSRCCGAKYGVACTSGTTALHLALATLGVGKGDEVIIPTFTMIATANAVTYTGAEPILVDSELKTWNIDPTKIEDKITERTKAIIPVHTYGHPADMDKILALAKKYHLFVIEDAAQAHGAEYKGKRIGSIGDVACFSFYANKIIVTGEGGMVTTNNKKFAERARNLRDHAFSKERHFWHKSLGFNYRMTNLQAAVGLAQTERFDQLVKIRIEHARMYKLLLQNIRGITLPPETKGIKNVFWMYSILIENDFGRTRDQVRQYLAKRGIETRTFFIPIHWQPIYFRMFKENFPIAEALCRKGMYLPSAPTLKGSQIKFVANTIREIYGRS